MMKKYMTRMVALLLALLMVLGLAGCGGSGDDEPSGTGAIKEEMIIGTNDDIVVLDPCQTVSSRDLEFMMCTHNTLIKQDEENLGTFYGDLCESFEQVSDVEWKFKLRQGVKFHNGEELKASDVLFTFDRAKDSSYTSDNVSWIKSFVADDDYNLTMTLTEPVQDILYYISYLTLSIVNEKACTEDPTNGPAVGTGPFMMKEHISNDHTTIVRFDDYFGEAPKTKCITWKIIPEASARMVALQAGEIDFVLNPARIELSTVEGDSKLQLFTAESEQCEYLVFNVSRAPWNDERVRQAFAYAIDKQAVLTVAEEGFGVVANTFFSPGFGRTEDVNKYEKDLDKAKDLLKQAGFDESNPLEFTAYTSMEYKTLQAQVIQDNLKQIGVTMHIETMEHPALKQLFKTAEFDVSFTNWSNDACGPDSNSRPLFYTGNGSNRSHTSDPWIDAQIDKAAVEQDKAAREQQYVELQQYIIDKAPIIPLYFPNVYVPAGAGVQNFEANTSQVHRYAYAYVVE